MINTPPASRSLAPIGVPPGAGGMGAVLKRFSKHFLIDICFKTKRGRGARARLTSPHRQAPAMAEPMREWTQALMAHGTAVRGSGKWASARNAPSALFCAAAPTTDPVSPQSFSSCSVCRGHSPSPPEAFKKARLAGGPASELGQLPGVPREGWDGDAPACRPRCCSCGPLFRGRRQLATGRTPTGIRLQARHVALAPIASPRDFATI